MAHLDFLGAGFVEQGRRQLIGCSFTRFVGTYWLQRRTCGCSGLKVDELDLVHWRRYGTLCIGMFPDLTTIVKGCGDPLGK